MCVRERACVCVCERACVGVCVFGYVWVGVRARTHALASVFSFSLFVGFKSDCQFRLRAFHVTSHVAYATCLRRSYVVFAFTLDGTFGGLGILNTFIYQHNMY